MIRVLLVDDHSMVRVGLERLLQQTDDIEVAGIAADGEAALELDAELAADVVLMDLSMPGVGGIEATRELCRRRPDARVVMLTAHTERPGVLAALDAGACGYLVKDSDPEVLIDGVRAAARGDAPLDSRAARAVLDARAAAANPKLTARELDVLTLVAAGMPNKLIARRLQISEKTVKSHLTRVFSVIGVTDRTQAALWAKDNLDLPAKGAVS
jgi:DNA-binding NarL/FixJ family response regulator